MSVKIDPIVPWVGGKRVLAKSIAGLISAIEHKCYVEPCVGMGGVFFRRSMRAKAEVINDINEDVITMFRVSAEHPDELKRHVARLLHARAEFQRMLKVPADTLTDVQRSARFILLQAAAFGGKVVSRSFGYSLDGPGRVSAGRLVERLERLHMRLQGVVIEKLDLFNCLVRYDRPDTLFYIDPPYYGTERYYGDTWSRSDFRRLAEALQRLRGKFILSINDVPETREIFSNWPAVAAHVPWSVGNKDRAAVGRELILSSAKVLNSVAILA